jgi:hypothetical protein
MPYIGPEIGSLSYNECHDQNKVSVSLMVNHTQLGYAAITIHLLEPVRGASADTPRVSVRRDAPNPYILCTDTLRVLPRQTTEVKRSEISMYSSISYIQTDTYVSATMTVPINGPEIGSRYYHEIAYGNTPDAVLVWFMDENSAGVRINTYPNTILSFPEHIEPYTICSGCKIYGIPERPHPGDYEKEQN